jgi:hypothetical protein
LLVWVVVCLLPLDGDGVAWWAARFVLLAALVWVPLGLRLMEGPTPGMLPRLVIRLQPWCAVLLVGSFLLPAGLLAAVAALPWALWTALLGLRGLARLREYPLRAAEELCLTLGMVSVPVGGVWLLAARVGVPLMGFVQPITLLTGMHFHYAGLLMPTIVGLAGRLLASEGRGWPLYRVLGPSACLGVWLVAAGITVGGTAEALAGTVFATLLAATAAVLLLQATPHVGDRLGQALLIFALLATWPAMGLAALYALSQVGLASIGLETMALLHGSLLAIVFVGGGLTGLSRIRPAPR